MIRTELTDRVAENSTSRLTATLVDLDAVGFKPDAVTLLLYDLDSRAVINSKDRVSVLSSVDANGNVSLELTPADNAIVGSRWLEKHVALFEWSWSSGTRQGKHEIVFTVRNLDKVPVTP